LAKKSKECEVCGHWIKNKEIKDIKDFLNSRKSKIFKVVASHKVICSSCLFKGFRHVWDSFITWLVATKNKAIFKK